MTGRRDIVLLGSTGSIGTQAFDVIERNPERFRVTVVAAGGGDPALLAAQAARHRVRAVGVGRVEAVDAVVAAVEAVWPADAPRPSVRAGAQEVAELAASGCDTVLNAVDGSVGLRATLAGLQAGRVVALANKESLIAGGPLVTRLASEGQLVPVDSEHSAIAQCLRAGAAREVRRLLVTASAARSAAVAAPSSPTSPRPRRWPTRPGTWASWSPPIPRRWSTRAWRSSRRTCSSASPTSASRPSCTRSR